MICLSFTSFVVSLAATLIARCRPVVTAGRVSCGWAVELRRARILHIDLVPASGAAREIHQPSQLQRYAVHVQLNHHAGLAVQGIRRVHVIAMTEVICCGKSPPSQQLQ